MGAMLKAIPLTGPVVNVRANQLAFIKALNDTADEGLRDYRQTVKTFKRRPTFRKSAPVLRGGLYTIHYGTDDENYRRLDEGTRPHIIVARRAKVLRFQGNYRAKTQVRVIDSRSGGPSGRFIFRPVVRHPGTKAREFTKVIQTRQQRILQGRMQADINKANK